MRYVPKGVKMQMKHIIKIQATVTVKDKNGKVLAVAKSHPNNLILNNFGLMLAGLIRGPIAAAGSLITLNDVVPSAQTIRAYNTAVYTFNCANLATGTQVQVGSGTTAAARTNTNIETAFGTSPENTRFATGDGSYVNGIITFSGSVTAGGNGTINEVGLFGAWSSSVGALKYFMLFHDILAAGIPFVAGNIIIVSYSIQL